MVDFVDFVDFEVVVVAGFAFAAVLVPWAVADLDVDAIELVAADLDVVVMELVALADFDLSAAIVPPALAVSDLDADMAPGVPHLTNFPEASRQGPPLAAAAVGHLTNLPDASRH